MKLDPKASRATLGHRRGGSFQTAADRLGLTQPALSRNMKALETRLGATLFNRDGRKSVPNALGLQAGPQWSGHPAGRRTGQRSGRSVCQGAVGELRIGAPPIVAGRFLSSAVAKFIRDNPNCVVEMRTGLVHELRTMLERGQVDLSWPAKPGRSI